MKIAIQIKDFFHIAWHIHILIKWRYFFVLLLKIKLHPQ